MKSNYSKITLLLFSLFLIIGISTPSFAAGTYSDGWMVVNKLVKLENGGIMFESWEGELSVSFYNKKEECDEAKYSCYTPVKKSILFSVRPENAETVNFLRKVKEGGEFLIHYRIHRCEAIALSTRFEILETMDLTAVPVQDLPEKKIVHKTGSRNFSVPGKVLDLSYQGVMIGTYEGLYLNQKTGKVHPFSVTDESMAEYIWKTMRSSRPYNIGVSVAIVTGFRKSDHDIFEINYLEEAGAATVEKTKKSVSTDSDSTNNESSDSGTVSSDSGESESDN